MLFSSPIFIFLFLPLVFFTYQFVPRRFKNLHLLIASLIFYSLGEQKLALVLIVSTLTNYFLAKKLTKGKAKKKILIIGVIFNLGILISFKYLSFFTLNINILASYFQIPPLNIPSLPLPLGVSFYTFHTLSYLFDIYRKKAKPAKSIIDFALYVSFFPQLIAGPIIRYHDISSQLVKRIVTNDKLQYGITRFIQGLAKKVLIANSIGLVADAIFASPVANLNPALAWFGVICYALQIYFDFSGYSDMAIGLGKMFGFDILENFNYPYISQSITEFWRRWHISLSNWFKDYVYIPLGGNRGGTLKTVRNLMIVFLLCGFWHGASWNFIVWGASQGGFLVIERLGLKKITDSLWWPLRHVYALTIILISWVFFRSISLDYALHFIAKLFNLGQNSSPTLNINIYLTPQFILILVLGVIFCTPIWQKLQNKRFSLTPAFNFTYHTLLIFLFLLTLMHLATATYSPFIYFRF